jgi:thiol-disulfide isomerase/thioredoxin
LALGRLRANRAVGDAVKAAAMMGEKLVCNDKIMIKEQAAEQLKEWETKISWAVKAYKADKDNKDKTAFEILDVDKDGKLQMNEFLAAFDATSEGKYQDLVKVFGMSDADIVQKTLVVSPQEKAKVVLDLLGSDLAQKAGNKPIGLYFSAHWCPPCRGFTPKLIENYKNGLREKMEIIFVSADRSQKEFDEYFGEMPWLALPYSKRKEQQELSEAFGIEGIPSFVVIGADGITITTDGCSKVVADPKGNSFPHGWFPPPCKDINEDTSALMKEQCVVVFDGPESSGTKAVKAVAAEYFEKAGKAIESMPMRFFWAPEGAATQVVRNFTGFEGNGLLLLDIPGNGGFYVCEKNEITVDIVREFICDVQEKKIDLKKVKQVLK